MFKQLAYKYMAKVYEHGFIRIEKTEWCTKILEVCYKNRLLKATWQSFLNSVASMLKDALQEVEQARGWEE